MYTIHTTEGFILKSVNFGEANRYFFIFTKDFGLVKAAAQGVRHLKSKLRYNLLDFTFCQFSLVQGREIWRITSAEKKLEIKDDKKLLLLSKIFSLLLRLLHGEERNSALFDILKKGFSFLLENELTNEDLINLECIFALRTLSSLGYIGKIPDLDQFTKTDDFTSDILVQMSPSRARAISEINKSLKETHL